MRILWLCNIVLPELCEEFGLKKTNFGGWLTGMWQELKKEKGVELGICVPIIDEFRRKDGIRDDYSFFSFPFQKEENISHIQEEHFEGILETFVPDIIHIWGTEYHHTWAMVKACIKKGLQTHLVINIQGLLSYCHQLYGFSIPFNVMQDHTWGKTIYEEKTDMESRSRYEILALENVYHVIGRTDWDQCCVQHISKANYYNCGEILREIFYNHERKWDVDRCERHSIFISQAGYPLKGFHLILESIYRLREKYSDLKVFVAGIDLRTKETAYAHYICDEIKGYALDNVICFTGPLSDEEMYQYYLKANVFLSPSTEENSSNSVGEAMMIGIPVVASHVGGLPSMIAHGKSGFLYPLTEVYMMEYYIESIFENQSLAKEFSCNSKIFAGAFHNKKAITEKMMKVYKTIISEASSFS